MKTSRYSLFVLTVVMLTLSASAGEDIVTNRLSFSGRIGFNISARFKNVRTAVGNPPAPRTTPNGDPYNYDDGYVLTDVSGNYGGQTWYWGYDNSASQISGNTILLSRTTSTVGGGATDTFQDNPSYGCELTYNRFLGVCRKTRYGVEVAANYLDISMSARDTFASSATRVTDAYPFTPGTTPPNATPPNTIPGPYQGSFEGPGFVIGDTPVSSSTVVVPGPALTDKRRFDADLWGFRLGPYFEMPLSEPVNLSISGGLAVGILDAEASWSQTSGSTRIASGSGSDCDVLWGGYINVALTWYLSERWSLVGGGQYQSLANYENSFGGRKVEVDLGHTWFMTFGLSYTF